MTFRLGGGKAPVDVLSGEERSCAHVIGNVHVNRPFDRVVRRWRHLRHRDVSVSGGALFQDMCVQGKRAPYWIPDVGVMSLCNEWLEG